jgi:dTDP-4-amino-4,6-dideoxygalactose transaminase
VSDTPIFPEGPPAWPRPDDDVQRALAAAYADGSWGKYHAGHVERLAGELAAMHAVDFALPCCSGTFAVELALRALKTTAGDEVALAAYDFPGNFRAIEAVGAKPVLVDVEPETWSMSADSLAQVLSTDVKAVIVSHLHGGLADMRAITELCRARGIAVIEDACQTPSGEVQGKMAGAWGDIGVLSFGGSKPLTSGRGGAILTSSADIAQRAKIFCERGNHAFPLPELAAVVLLPQLKKLAAQNAIRQARADHLRAATASLPGFAASCRALGRGAPAYYKFAWLYEGDQPREGLIDRLRAEGVAIDAGFRGFAGRSSARCRKAGDLVHSRRAAVQTLILHHPVLLESPGTIDRLAAAIAKSLQR